jgi:hypothetical protein
MLDFLDTKKAESEWEECGCRGNREATKIGIVFVLFLVYGPRTCNFNSFSNRI